MRDFQKPGRSTVHSQNGMAATSQPLATLAAVDMLKAGGNAVDAAVTASAVQAVVEPHSTGIGGDCFVLYAPAGSEEIIALNGSGQAPAAATLEWYRAQGFEKIPLQSPHAVTVPGAVGAWARLLADHGTKNLDEVLRPAIEYAERGYVVHPCSAHDWGGSVEKLSAQASAARIFLPGGRAARAGEVHRQPLLAKTLEVIAREGRDGFYLGAVAADIVDYLRSLGGLHTLEDLAAQRSEYVLPIKTTYRGYEVYQCPPNGQGIAVLFMLNILEGFDLRTLEPLGVERLHLQAEATRLAYDICETTIGDPSCTDVPVDDMLSKQKAEALRRRIRPDGLITDLPTVAPVHPETVYLTVVDGDRNAVSFINSLCFAFGSGLVSPKTGVVLQNRGAGFMLTADHPNCIGPGKRPRHTIIPGLLAKSGRAVMPFGVMGGQYQPVGQVQLLTNVLDFEMDLQQAIDLPRSMHFAGVYMLETGVLEPVADGLRRLGYDVERMATAWGSAQAIWIDWERGTLTGGSDPRKDGCAIGY